MKLVKEHINEKFVEDSDPIKDMGIGGTVISDIRDRYRKRYKHDKELGRRRWGKRIEKLLEGKSLTGKFKQTNNRITVIVRNVDSYAFGDRIEIDTVYHERYDLLENEPYIIKNI